MNYKKSNNLFGWVTFCIALITYYLTLEPTVSFWDCGEYISTAFKLEVGHPPGAPLFQLLGRFFSLFASDVSNVAFMINLMCAICSALTILFLFWTITSFARKIVLKSGELDLGNKIAIIGSGIVGALAYTFSDSFWFSAVEGEVYAMSSFFTAITFWAILKWEAEADDKHASRWIILIAYIVGLSVGVHLLNLLAIPAVVFIYYFKKHEVTRNGFIKALIIAIVITGGIQSIVIPGIVSLAGKFELFFVNTIGLPFNSGTIIYFLAILSSIVFGLKYAKRKNKNILSISLVSFAMILIGYSTFFILVIRSNADTPIDENNPEDAVSLLSYLNREQYGSWPILSGQYYNANLIAFEDGNPVYKKNEEAGKYSVTNKKKDSEPVYDEKFSGFFPRMWSSSGANSSAHARGYKQWSGHKNQNQKPTFGQNLKYFFNYQIGHMYLRYFMWNFAGRQNDIQGHGEINKGNWLSGIPFIDNSRLGPQENITKEMASNKGRNTYYFLPLLLGLIGLFFHFQSNNKDAFVTLLLFLFTGLAIVVYLNQAPFQPRERDYAYVGSFYAFAIWIGIGVLAIFDFLKNKMPKVTGASLATAICLLLVPTIMATENWDDHDRSDRYTARDIAANYLNSCAPNAIIFTNGDNDTFPLWYAQEVEGIRTDIRVINLSLFNTDWYIDQMRRAAYEASPIPSSLDWSQYKQGTRDYVPIFDKGIGHVDVKEVINFIKDDSEKTKTSTSRGRTNFIPTKELKLTIDKEKILANGVVSADQADQIVDEVKWKLKGQGIYKNQMMVLDILANFAWERPIYFAITVGADNFMGLDKYFQLEGLAYRFVPVLAKSKDNQVGDIAEEIMYDNLMNKFSWGNMQDTTIYLDETNRRMTLNFRNNFARLADALIRSGKFDKAELVLDKCLETMPNEAVAFNYFNIPIAENYYKLGKTEKARKVVGILSDYYFDEIEYYQSIDAKTLTSMQRDFNVANQIIGNLYSISNQYNDTVTAVRIAEMYKSYQ
jgi:hypothetical protein